VGLGLPGGHVGYPGMVGAVGPGLSGGHVGSWVMAGHVVPGLLAGHVSRDTVGDFVLDLPPAMLVPRSRRWLLNRA